MEKIGQLKDFLSKDPEDSFLKHALALEYIKLGDDRAARSLFEQILYQNPGYVGSYYHLAKLLERTGEGSLAIEWYEKGMKMARAANDDHTYNELQAAYEDLAY